MTKHLINIMNTTDLERKNIFDFCDDKEVICFVSGLYSPSLNEYLQHYDDEEQLWHLRLLNFIVHNDRLNEYISQFPFLCVEWSHEVWKFIESYRQKHPNPNDEIDLSSIITE